MHSRRWTRALLATTLILAADRALAAIDTDLVVEPGSSKDMKVEKPSPARDYIDHIGVYIRVIPLKGNRVYPVFINTRNYLTCPDSDKKWLVNDVRDVAFDRRKGVRVLGFFFDKPSCEKATLHFEGITAEPGDV